MSRTMSFSLGIALIFVLVFAGLAFAQTPTATSTEPATPTAVETPTTAATVAPTATVAANVATGQQWGPARGGSMMGNAMRGMMQAGRNFIDGDGDGVCDNFVDEDGDGLCDNCQGAGGSHHWMKNQSMGGRRGMMGQGMGQNMTQGQQQSPQWGMGRGWNR